tara:strand:- start:62 stop:604 length:543 start_codon:yes stop_codon:yes gene_type:complete
MAINFGSSASGLENQKYASNVCRVYHFSDATHNISIPNQAAAGPITFNFTKAYADTNIILWGLTPVSGRSSSHAGCYIYLKDVSSGAQTRKYESAHFNTPERSGGDDYPYGTILWQGMWSGDAAVNTAGNKEVLLGWSTRNSANEQPGNYWNPSERSARTRDRTTNITIIETFGNTTLIT